MSTLLARLIAERHWTREDFRREFSRTARSVLKADRELSTRQADRWLAGDVGKLPYASNCRVLEVMFQRRAEELLQEERETTGSGLVQAETILSLPVSSFEGPTLDLDGYSQFLLAIFSQYANADYMFGPHSVLGVVREHLRHLEQLMVSRAAPPHCYYVAARYAEFLSWLHQDLGQRELALSWADRAYRWAQNSDNSNLLSYTLVRKAAHLSESGEATLSAHLAAHAGSYTDLSFRAQALAAHQEAQARAMEGDEHGFSERMEHAEELVSESVLHKDSSPGRYCVPSYMQLQRALCWLKFRKPNKALDVFPDGIDALPNVHRRDKGVYLATYSHALLLSHRPEEAAHTARKALVIAQETGSMRNTSTLATVHRLLSEWQELQPVSELCEELAVWKAQHLSVPSPLENSLT